MTNLFCLNAWALAPAKMLALAAAFIFSSAAYAGPSTLSATAASDGPKFDGAAFPPEQEPPVSGPSEPQNYYYELESWHYNGRPAFADDVKGFFAGRCFEIFTKDTPINAVLGYDRAAPVTNPGPGFPHAPLDLAVLSLTAYSGDFPQRADYWDRLIEEGRENELVNVANLVARSRYERTVSRLEESMSGAQCTQDFEPNGRPDLLVSYRMRNNYIVSKVENLIPNNAIYSTNLRRVVYGVPAGAVQYCYYFRKLAN